MPDGNARYFLSDRYVYLFPLREPGQESGGPSESDVDVSFVSKNLNALVGQRLDYTAFARDTPPGQKGGHICCQMSIVCLPSHDAPGGCLPPLNEYLLRHVAVGNVPCAGKACECTLYTARASIISIPASTADSTHPGQAGCSDTADASPRLGDQGGSDAGMVSSACGARVAGTDQALLRTTRVLCIELVADRFLRR